MNAPAKTEIAEQVIETFIPVAPCMYSDIPSDVYHGSAGESKSSLDLALISGQHYRYYKIDGNQQKETVPFREGKILHKIVLEFDDFESEYAIEPVWPEDAFVGADQMKAAIEEYNAGLEKRPELQELADAIEAYNAKLTPPIELGATVGDAEAAYCQLPESFQTIGEDDKRTATALKACVKAYNDTLTKPLKSKGSYQAVLENYAKIGAKELERAERIATLPDPLPLSGTKAEMAERIRTFNPDAKFLDELKEQFREQAGDKVIVTNNEYIHALRYREAVLNHPEAAVLLDEGEAETSIYWRHPETGELLKCRPDWKRPDHVLVDLKFVRNASEAAFARDGSAHNYHIQDAHYTDGYEAVTGHPASFVFIAVEKDGPLGHDVYKPIMVGVYFYGQEDRRRGLELRDMAVRNIVTWRKANYYPGHDGMGEINVPQYQAAAERHRINNEEPFTPTVISHEPVAEELPDSLFY
ncbi:PD-(D/E)XK nuclease-like domain-containing protein [Aeromonas veronii]